MTGENLVGKILGNRYEILQIIGTGGMATVYKAKCRLLNRFVAVKVLKSEFKNDETIVKKFNTESQAAASLSHNNIVSVFDVGNENGISYIVMEYVDGITLKEYISQKGALPWDQACRFAGQIALALEHAHNKNIIHRDIKPHNILMTKDLTLKVTDFGIARAVSGETLVAGSGAIGSVHYISPEQARGGYTDARSDLYSLGIVLYEMLTGALPFDGDNPVAVALMHLNNEPADIRSINPDIPEPVARIVMKAISKEQNARYQTAHEMIIDLKNALSMENTDTVGSSGMGDTRKIVLPHEERQSGESQPSEGKKKGKKEKTYEQKRDDKFAITLAIATVVLIAAIALGTFLFLHGGGREKMVPDLLNKTIEEAQSIAEQNGFKIDENIIFEASDTIEMGHIIKQDPGANQSVKKDKISIVVSNGKGGETIDVPNVVNSEYKKAAETLKNAGFDYKIEEQESESVAENYVIRQSPSAGEKAPKGSSVIIYISKAKESEHSIVPKLIGATEEEAEKLLNEHNLKIRVNKQYSSEVAEGKVISQSPSSGSEAAKNSTVNVVISRGTEPTSTPAAEPTPKPTSEPTSKPATKKTLTLTLPSDREKVRVRVVANGKTIHDETHDTSKGVVNIPVSSTKDASVEVYFDDVLVSERVIEFD